MSGFIQPRNVLAFGLLVAMPGCSTGAIHISAGSSPTPTTCSTSGVICALGSEGIGDGGPALQATLIRPRGMVFDGAGNLYVAEEEGNRIRKIDPSGTITTVAGTGQAVFPPITGSPAVSSAISHPGSLAFCPDGWLIWNEEVGDALFGLDPATGNYSLLAGQGNGTPIPTTPVAPTVTTFLLDDDTNLYCDSNNILYIPDGGDSVYRAWNRGSNDATVAGVDVPAGMIAIVAGVLGVGTPAGADGVSALDSVIAEPSQAYPAPGGALIVSDLLARKIRSVNSSGVISTIAGTTFGFSGDGAAATAAQFNDIEGFTLDATGRLFLNDNSQRVRLVNTNAATSVTFSPTITVAAGEVDTVAGVGRRSFPYPDGSNALFQQMDFTAAGPVLDGSGNLFLADTENGVIREVASSSGNMSVVAGLSSAGTLAEYMVVPLHAVFNHEGQLLVTAFDARLWSIDPVSGARTLVAGSSGNPVWSAADDGGPALTAGFFGNGLDVGPDGTLYVADEYNAVIRTISPAGIIGTLAGTGVAAVTTSAGDGGLASAAQFETPVAVAVNSAGTVVFVADHTVIRAINISASSITVAGVTIAAGNIDRVAGDGVAAFGGDGGPALSASLDIENLLNSGMAISGNDLYIADTENNRIRVLDLDAGTLNTAAGNGQDSFGVADDGAPPLLAEIGAPQDLKVFDGYLYWIQSDPGHVSRFLLPDGNVESLGGGLVGGYFGDGGPAIGAELPNPRGLAIDPSGAVFLADPSHRIRRIAP